MFVHLENPLPKMRLELVRDGEVFDFLGHLYLKLRIDKSIATLSKPEDIPCCDLRNGDVALIPAERVVTLVRPSEFVSEVLCFVPDTTDARYRE